MQPWPEDTETAFLTLPKLMVVDRPSRDIVIWGRFGRVLQEERDEME